MNSWQLPEAKARFSEFLDAALIGGRRNLGVA
jgi:hypothetical protein